MKHHARKTFDRVAPRHQRNWDERAAANFIAGGAGGSLVLFAAVAGLDPDATRTAILFGLMLVAGGLTCVWFEIGRPWRALNVYRHFATSWMTREAVVALALFAAGALAWLSLWTPLTVLAGILGLAFLYSQARILGANKGIPAWRHPRSISLVTATGLAEGGGFLACVASMSSSPLVSWAAMGLIALIAGRVVFWKRYLHGLTADGAPVEALKALRRIDFSLVMFGHVVPALAMVAVLAGLPGRAALTFAAGIMVVAAGWLLKYTLIRRAAYTQGLAVLHLPVRGRGAGGASAKPGWAATIGAKAL